MSHNSRTGPFKMKILVWFLLWVFIVKMISDCCCNYRPGMNTMTRLLEKWKLAAKFTNFRRIFFFLVECSYEPHYATEPVRPRPGQSGPVRSGPVPWTGLLDESKISDQTTKVQTEPVWVRRSTSKVQVELFPCLATRSTLIGVAFMKAF